VKNGAVAFSACLGFASLCSGCGGSGSSASPDHVEQALAAYVTALPRQVVGPPPQTIQCKPDRDRRDTWNCDIRPKTGMKAFLHSRDGFGRRHAAKARVCAESLLNPPRRLALHAVAFRPIGRQQPLAAQHVRSLTTAFRARTARLSPRPQSTRGGPGCTTRRFLSTNRPRRTEPQQVGPFDRPDRSSPT
jgi:hypothetical protein